MKQRLLNGYEEVTYDALARVCESNGARVFPKVRVADVFKMENSGISPAHFGFGLRSHFDFVVTDHDYQPQFSVEFDGPQHKTSDVQKRRDALKNDLCKHFDHGLLRINSKYLTPAYRGLDLLTYFVDAWFMEQAFNEAQRNGTIPYDESFDITFLCSVSSMEGKEWPYWLSLDLQRSFDELHKAKCTGQMVPAHYVGTDERGNYHCRSWLVMDAQHVLFADTAMRAQRFSAVSESDLVSMLAMFDLYPKVEKALAGGRRDLVNRAKFFNELLPAFESRYAMASALGVGATV